MKIRGLVWVGDVIEKLLVKHHVHQNEVREVFNSNPHFRFVEKGNKSSENVYAALGRTNGGRYLIIFFVYKKDGRAIIISARDMTKDERKRYEEK